MRYDGTGRPNWMTNLDRPEAYPTLFGSDEPLKLALILKAVGLSYRGSLG